MLAREHDQIQRLKDRGLTDADIDALGNDESTDTSSSNATEEEINENKIF